MSLVKDMHNPALDNLVQASLESENKYFRLEWISCSQITHVEPTQIDNVYYAIHKDDDIESKITLLSLVIGEECTPIFVSEFARIYSLLTRKYNRDGNQFRRYSIWLEYRNRLIKGFTKYEDNYYMVADRQF